MGRQLALQAIAFGLLSYCSACKPKQSLLDASQIAGERQGQRPSNTSTPTIGSTQIDNAETAPASYLLSADDVIKLRPLVEPYRQPRATNPGGNYTQNFATYRTFAETQLNRIMSLPALTPGRRIRVNIADNDQVNAFAGGYQDVTINSGTVRAIDSTELLAVLCHELAHTARNHSVKAIAYQDSGALASDATRFYDARAAYFKTAYNDATQAYTHDVIGYRKVLALWNVMEPRFDFYVKRQESEADILGAAICGRLGMPLDTYISALLGFLTAGDAAAATHTSSDAKTADQLDTGDKFTLDPDNLTAYLFRQDSHPSNAERRSQLLRLKSSVSDQFDPSQRLYADWTQGYAHAVQGLGLTGLSLADAAQNNTITVRTDNGKIIKIQRPTLCGPSLSRP